MYEFHVIVSDTKRDKAYSYYVYCDTVSEAALRAITLFQSEFGKAADFQVIVISKDSKD